MSRITVSAPRSISRTVQQQAKVAAEWIADHLGIPSSYSISIKLNTRRSRWSVARRTGPACCEIEMATTAYASTLETAVELPLLAHELVHAKQYALGELRWVRYDRELGGHRKSWKGDERWGGQGEYVKGSRRGCTRYRKLPWELEAYGRQNDIASAYRLSQTSTDVDRLRMAVAATGMEPMVVMGLVHMLRFGLPASWCTRSAWMAGGAAAAAAAELGLQTIAYHRRSHVALAPVRSK